ncbi:MAG: uncharacterized protein KVP18_001597 [Porospora cf. gigantea A]|uniref:uncharacterized protein n=2 Tax=Porospora cf. gigantea A TaxID=2853593 RepID=UPI003559A2E1|nr:MAG: hypothetical protein KVP18_001597 [Porospora cf. gigantea A]
MVSRLHRKGSVSYRMPNAITPSKSTTIGAKTTASERVAGHPTSPPVNELDTWEVEFIEDNYVVPATSPPVNELDTWEERFIEDNYIVPATTSSLETNDNDFEWLPTFPYLGCPVTPLRHCEIPSDLSSGFCTPTCGGVSSEESHVYRKRLRRPLPSFSFLEARYERLRRQREREESRSRTWAPASGLNMKLKTQVPLTLRRSVYVSYLCIIHADCFVASTDAELHEEETKTEAEVSSIKTVMLRGKRDCGSSKC